MQTAPETNGQDTKKATMNGLAVVGFGALIIAGIFLAIYAARYVPETLSRLSSAVILSSDNEPEEEEETPAPAEEEEPDEEEEPETPSTGGPNIVTPPVAVSPNPPVYYPPVYYPSTPNLYGDADLIIINAKVGYFSGSRFVEDDEVPNGRDAGVTFTIQNRGTNVADDWRVRVEVENERPVTGNGGRLMPNGVQNFTIRIENPEEGENLEIEIEADFEDDLDESNERNNDESLDIDIDD